MGMIIIAFNVASYYPTFLAETNNETKTVIRFRLSISLFRPKYLYRVRKRSRLSELNREIDK